jgi:hypothetical protein
VRVAPTAGGARAGKYRTAAVTDEGDVYMWEGWSKPAEAGASAPGASPAWPAAGAAVAAAQRGGEAPPGGKRPPRGPAGAEAGGGLACSGDWGAAAGRRGARARALVERIVPERCAQR